MSPAIRGRAKGLAAARATEAAMPITTRVTQLGRRTVFKSTATGQALGTGDFSETVAPLDETGQDAVKQAELCCVEGGGQVRDPAN